MNSTSNPVQLDLFSSVIHAYSKGESGPLTNAELYEKVADIAGVSPEQANARHPVGKKGVSHNLFKRKIRWYQQTLKAAGILESVPGERGVWQLTKPASKDLSAINPGVAVLGFSTDLGVAILGSCDSVFSSIDAPITLVVTSPPYPLARARNYGNPSESEYVDWLCKTIEPVVKCLVPGGSICLNVSNDIFMPKSPARSMYCERLLLALHDRLGLHLMDRLIWENPQKPPGPLQYASLARTQLNVGYEPIYWLTNDPSRVRSNNRRVLQAHTERHLQLIASGGETREAVYADGAYRIRTGSFGNATEGRIPRNILRYGHRCASQSRYKKLAAAHGLPVHGAPMPLSLAKFLVEFLTEPGDVVGEIFAGSFTTPLAAELLGRRWLATEIVAEYVMGGSLRFEAFPGFFRNLPITKTYSEAKSGILLA